MLGWVRDLVTAGPPPPPSAAMAEERSYTSRVIAESTSTAEGLADEAPTATAELEAAAGLYSAAFAAARLEPDVPALTSEVRALIARNLIRLGQDQHQIEVRDGILVLVPVGYAYPYSDSPDPMRWLYQSSVYTPSGSRHQWILSGAMLHCRYGVDSERPWVGIAPWKWAASTGSMSAHLEKRLSEEVGGAVGRVIPLPASMAGPGDEDKLAQFKTDFAGLKGRATFVPTTADGGGEGRMAAPARDWKQERIGPMPDAQMVSLRSDAALAVLAVCGVPAALVTDADGMSQREAWRRWSMGPLVGLARVVEDEIARKLDVRTRFDFGPLWAWDMAGRAQSFKAMVTAGMDAGKAAALSGLMDD